MLEELNENLVLLIIRLISIGYRNKYKPIPYPSRRCRVGYEVGFYIRYTVKINRTTDSYHDCMTAPRYNNK